MKVPWIQIVFQQCPYETYDHFCYCHSQMETAQLWMAVPLSAIRARVYRIKVKPEDRT